MTSFGGSSNTILLFTHAVLLILLTITLDESTIQALRLNSISHTSSLSQPSSLLMLALQRKQHYRVKNMNLASSSFDFSSSSTISLENQKNDEKNMKLGVLLLNLGGPEKIQVPLLSTILDIT
jgi:hypothetical protein